MNPFSSQLYEGFHGMHLEIEKTLNLLPPEALDWQPGVEMNSIAVLIAHICGAERYLVGDAVMGEASNRDRTAEFLTHAVSSLELIQKVHQTDEYLLSAFERLSLPDLECQRIFPRDGRKILAGWAILHAFEHTSSHLGQISLTYQLWNQREKNSQ
jgi:hypothetical protein